VYVLFSDTSAAGKEIQGGAYFSFYTSESRRLGSDLRRTPHFVTEQNKCVSFHAAMESYMQCTAAHHPFIKKQKAVQFSLCLATTQQPMLRSSDKLKTSSSVL